MSPLTKRAKEGQVREIGVEGQTRKVQVQAIGKDIRVTWFCGGHREFTVEELRKEITLMDGPGSRHLMWFDMTDSRSRRFWAKLEEGKLTANESMHANGFVAWSELKRALQATIAEILA